MSVLSDNYKRIMSEIETKITNQEELEFIKAKISELSMSFMDAIDSLADSADCKIKQIEEKQKMIEERMKQVQDAVDEIEGDIYEDCECSDSCNCEFEIVCPYCNNEFTAEIDNKSEITCPECNNIIELDWNEENDDECSGNCMGCHGCSEEDDEDI